MSQILAEALRDLKEDEVMAEVKAFKEKKVPLRDILQQLQEGMELVGNRFEAGEYYLSELIMQEGGRIWLFPMNQWRR